MISDGLNGRVEDLAIEDLEESEWNPQEMKEREFARLQEELKTVGQIDPIQVVPLSTGKFRILGGHHRTKAAKALGWKKISCVIISDTAFQDEDLQKLVTVRLNVIKGQLNAEKFIKLYNEMAAKYGKEGVASLLGITNQAAIQRLVGSVQKEIKKSLPKEFGEKFDKATKEVKSVDDLSMILNRLFNEHGCFPPGSLVETPDGPVAIEFIEVGDTIVNGKGEVAEVSRLWERTFSGELVALDLVGDREPLTLTPNHEVFVVRPWRGSAKQLRHGMDHVLIKVQAGDLEVGDWLVRPRFVANRQQTSFVVKPVRDVKLESKCSVDDCENSVASLGYCLGHARRFRLHGDPTVSRKKSGISKYACCSALGCELTAVAKGLCARHYRGQEIVKEVEGAFVVDENLAYLFGAYIAEGCETERQARFNLGIHETAFADRIAIAVKETFEKDCYIYDTPDKGSKTVCIQSRSLARFFADICGRLAENKHLPPGALHWSEDIVEALVAGMCDGDGSKIGSESGWAVSTVSQRLAFQLRALLVRRGFSAGLSWIEPRQDTHQRLYRIEWRGRDRKTQWRRFDRFLAVPIREIRKIPYTGQVHNLEIAGEHSYQVRGIAVGNSSLDQNYMVFVYGGKKHLYINCDSITWSAAEALAAYAAADKQDMNALVGEALVEYVRQRRLSEKRQPGPKVTEEVESDVSF